MARVTYQASPDNKEWSPNLVPDDSDRILKQTQDYIEKLKSAQEFERAQEVEFINKYSASIQRGIDSVRDVDLEKERQFQALARYKQTQLQRQADRARTLGGSYQGNDNSTLNWIKFITEASATALKTYGDIQQQREKIDAAFAAEQNALYPFTPKTIGQSGKEDGALVSGAYSDGLIPLAENSGNLELANDLRNMNAGQQAQVKKLRGEITGRQAYDYLMQEMYSPTSTVTVMFQGEEVPINDPRLRNSAAIREIFPEFRNKLFEAQGFDITKPIYRTGLAASNEVLEKKLGGMRAEELKAAKANWMEDSKLRFTARTNNGDQAQLAIIDRYQDHFNNNGGNHAAARASLIADFKNTKPSNAAFEALKQVVLPGQTKPFGELYRAEIDDLRQARLGQAQNQQKELDAQQQMEATEIARKVTQARLTDTEEDNDIDLSPETVKEQIDKYTRMGPNYAEAVRAYKSLIPELSSTIKDNELNDTFQDLADRGALSEDYIMRSEGSEDLKRKWLKQVNSSAEQSIPKTVLNDFKGIARAMLMDRTKETPGATGTSNKADTKRALRRAIQDFEKDYVTSIRDGSSPAQAAKYAEEMFNSRFASETGLYKVTNTERGADGKIAPGKYANFGAQQTEEIDEPLVHLNKKIEEFGSAVVDQPNVVSFESLQRTSTNMLQNNRIMIPPAIVTLADSTGGKLSVMDVLNRQLKANGLDQVPTDMFNTAQQTQEAINPVWHQVLNYKPQVETTDAALIASGQEPIYTIATPVQEQIKSIFGSRESPQAGYDAINRGTGGDTPGGATRFLGKPLTKMTVGEVMYYQNLPKGHPKGLLAVGKYQFIPKTLAQAIIDAGVTKDMLFNEAVQDRIFFVHLDLHGAHQPWEKWWIQQGGPHLALTAEEKQLIESWRHSYEPSDPWMQPKNLNPAVLPALPQSTDQAGGVAPLDLEAMGISTTPIN